MFVSDIKTTQMLRVIQVMIFTSLNIVKNKKLFRNIYSLPLCIKLLIHLIWKWFPHIHKSWIKYARIRVFTDQYSPYGGEYGSAKTSILAYFMLWKANMMTVNYYNKIASSFAPGYVKKRKVRLFTNMLILFHHLHV